MTGDWTCNGHGRELLIVIDWQQNEGYPIDERDCPGCPECTHEKAPGADEAQRA